MPFKSSEIRWFSTQQEVLWKLYEQLPQHGSGRREPDRTDYYLRSNTPHTGVKIREGNHEIKVKSGRDEEHPYGLIEHWTKWSSPEEEHILNSIEQDLLSEWIAVDKKRFKKVYEILNGQAVFLAEDRFVDEGCGVEFTKIHLPGQQKTLYTLGLEAFGTHHPSRENLLVALHNFKLEYPLLEGLDAMSYPEMLCKLGKEVG